MSAPLHAAKNTPPVTGKPSRIPTLFGGEVITVLKQDGTEIAVKVGVVPLRFLEKFIDLYDKPAEFSDFICHVDNKPVGEGWSDCLSDKAHAQIREKAKELNFQRAMIYAEEQITAGKEMALPIVEKMMALRAFVQMQVESLASAEKPSSTNPSRGSGS